MKIHSVFFRSFFSGLVLLSVSFVGLLGCSHAEKKDPSESQYTIADIRPFFRVKTVYYFNDEDALQDITQMPFLPMKVGREFGYVIPIKNGAPSWKIKEILQVTCDSGYKVHPQHQKERVIEWEKPETSLKIQSHNEFDATDCPGKYVFQIYIDGFLADQIELFVKPQESF